MSQALDMHIFRIVNWKFEKRLFENGKTGMCNFAEVGQQKKDGLPRKCEKNIKG